MPRSAGDSLKLGLIAAGLIDEGRERGDEVSGVVAAIGVMYAADKQQEQIDALEELTEGKRREALDRELAEDMRSRMKKTAEWVSNESTLSEVEDLVDRVARRMGRNSE